MRKTIKILAGWIHATLILAIVIPVIYALGTSRSKDIEGILYIKCLLIAIPVIGTGIAIKKCKNLFTYLVICILLFAGVFLSAWYLTPINNEGNIMWGYLVIIMVETFLVMLMRLMDRIDAKSDHKDNLAPSPYWSPERNLLDKPSIFMLTYFFIIYIVCKNFDNAYVCNEALISSIIYLFITILYEYIFRTEEYLSLNKRVCNLPSKRIYGIGSSALALFLLLLTIFILPSILTIKQRQYKDFNKWLAEREIDYSELIQEPERPEGGWSNPMGEFIEEQGPPKQLPLWVNYLFYMVEFLILAGVIFAALRGIYHAFHTFQDSYDENGDIVEKLEKSDIVEKKPFKKEDKKDTDKEKIRRQYRKVIRKHRKEKPYPYETPLEIETEAGIAGSEEGKRLHVQYEEARYGRFL